MSGRIGYIRGAEKEAVERRIADSDTDQSRKVARRLLQKLIVDYAGWKGIDAWASNALDKLEKGEPIDLRRLKEDIEEWRLEHGLDKEGEK